MSAPDAPERPAPACPICGKARIMEFTPFCSKRCADVDLGRWLGGRYAIPADDGIGEEAAPPADPTPRRAH